MSAAKTLLVGALALALFGLGSSTSRSATLDAGAGSDYATAVLADAPSAYWRLGEPDGSTTAVDSSGHGFNGTYARNAAPGADIAGALPFETDTAAAFTATTDSAYSDEIQLGNPVGLPAGEAPFTFEAWINTQVAAGAIAGRDDGYTDSPPGWVVYLGPTGRVYGQLFSGKYTIRAIGPGIDVSDGAWHHVVVAFDPNGVQRVSVDGLVGSDTQQRTPYVPFGRTPGNQVDTSGTTIGDTTGYPNFQGSIDEVAIYPSILPMSRVQAHYDAAQGQPASYGDELATEDMNGWWKLDDSSGATAADSSGYGYDGAYQNVGSDTGPLGDGSTAASFGGTSSVTIPDRPELNAGTGDFGVEAWVKTGAASGDRIIAAKGSPTGSCDTQPFWQVLISGNSPHAGNLALVYDDLSTVDAAGCGTRHVFYGPSLKLDDGQWHHLLVNVLRGDSVQLAADVFETTQTGATAGDLTNVAPLVLGGPTFTGDLAQVAYYPYALDSSRIAVHIDAAPLLEPTLSSGEQNAEPDIGPWDPVDTEDPGGPTFNAATAATSTAQLLHNTADYVDITNQDGTWRIYKRCLGPAERARQTQPGWDGGTASAIANTHPTFSVGPGYIAMLTRADTKVIVNDNREASFLNGVGMGGIGTFGFHWARAAKKTGNGPFDPGGGSNHGDVFNVDGRVCAEDQPTGQNSQQSGFGVASGSTVEQLAKNMTFNDGATGVFLLMKVDFKDPWVDGIAQVEYRYRFEASTVKVWMHVAFCVHACNLAAGVDDAHRYAFIKEPKFMTAVRGGGAPTAADPSHCTSLQDTAEGSTIQPECSTDYLRMTGIDARGFVRSNDTTTPAKCAWSENGFSAKPADWGIGDTGHCGAPDRLAGRWDFNPVMSATPPATVPNDGSCASKPCLVVQMEGYPPTGSKTVIPPTTANGYRPHLWDVRAAGRPGVGGLDLMALKYLTQQKTLTHPPFDASDSGIGNGPASTDNCHIGDVHTGKYTATVNGQTKTLQAPKQALKVRNWELIGGKEVDGGKQTVFKKTGDPYETASIMFSGWQGGNGYDDCEDLARLMPNKTDMYNLYGEYSLSTH